MLRRTDAGASPFIFFGDLNADVHDLVVQDWARRLRAKILKPSCGTCSAKGGASKIDFVILTEGLEARVLEYGVVMEVPFAPHAAIKLVIRMDLRFFSGRVFATPRELPAPAKGQEMTDEMWT